MREGAARLQWWSFGGEQFLESDGLLHCREQDQRRRCGYRQRHVSYPAIAGAGDQS
jgi:hypothetical protein